MENEINFDFSTLKIAQLGFVYRDVRKQAKIMESFFGIPKFTILGPVEMKIVYRGRETKWSALGAFGRLFNNIEIELIQYETGECIHKEFLDEGREGLHHIRYDVDDIQTVIKKFKEEGIEVLQTGKIISSTYAYMDTESILGIILEFSDTKRGTKRI